MKRILLICCLLFVTQLALSQSIVTLSVPTLKSTEATLSFYGTDYKTTFDSSGVATFNLQSSKYGYAEIAFGRAKLRIYLEPKSKLTIEHLSTVDKTTKLRYAFGGDLAYENEVLNRNEYNGYKFTPNNQTQFSDVASYLKTLIADNCAMIDAMKLSSKFKEVEKTRVKYLNSGYYSKFNKWSDDVFDYLRPLMVSDEKLFYIEEYKEFMKNAVYVMGYENLSERTAINHTKSQFQFVETNLGSTIISDYLKADILVKHLERNGVDGVDELVQRFEKNVKDIRAKKDVEFAYGIWTKLRKGTDIPAFSFKDRYGKDVSLATFKGKYVYIDCWASWCGPCLTQIPHMKKLEEEFKDEDIVFIGISTDRERDRHKWLKMLDDKAMSGIQLLDAETLSEFSKFFNITSIPRFILLDKEGRIFKAVMTRPSDEETKKELKNILNSTHDL